MFRILMTALLTLSLAGCVTAPDLPSDYVLNPKDPEGVAIVSLTLSGKTLDRVGSFEYRIRPVASHDGEPVKVKPYFNSSTQHARWATKSNGSESADLNVIVKAPNYGESLDVTDQGTITGRLVSLRLPAGEYEFYTWKLREPNSYGGTEYSPQQPFSFTFAVKPGQATYIGQLNLELSKQNSQKLTVEDKRERDIPLLRKKLPFLDKQVAVNIGRM